MIQILPDSDVCELQGFHQPHMMNSLNDSGDSDNSGDSGDSDDYDAVQVQCIKKIPSV